MKNEKTKEVIKKSNESGLQYKLRTEFRNDCVHIRSVLMPWLQMWSEKSGWEPWSETSLEPDGNSWNWSMDTDVEFALKAGAPQLSEIRWLISAIADCHVAAETVETFERYTGERFYECLEGQMETPSKDVIMAAIAAAGRTSDLHGLNRDTMHDTAQYLQKQLQSMTQKAKKSKSLVSVADFNARMREKRLAEKIAGIERRARKRIEQLRSSVGGPMERGGSSGTAV